MARKLLLHCWQGEEDKSNVTERTTTGKELIEPALDAQAVATRNNCVSDLVESISPGSARAMYDETQAIIADYSCVTDEFLLPSLKPKPSLTALAMVCSKRPATRVGLLCVIPLRPTGTNGFSPTTKQEPSKHSLPHRHPKTFGYGWE